MDNDHNNSDATNSSGKSNIWWRAFYMLLFTLLYSVAEVVLVAVVLFQFFAVLLFRSSNAQLLSFGQSLSTYIYQILCFLTFNSERHPYPFDPWPRGAPKQNNDIDEHRVD